MKRIFKNKFIACIIAAVIALSAAVFAVFYLNKNDTVEAQAATPITQKIYWDLSGASDSLTLTLSSSVINSAENYFSGAVALNFDVLPWHSNRTNITNVVIKDKIAPTCMDSWFYNLNVTTLDLFNIDTSNVTTFQSMCEGCTQLQSINLTGWVTSNAERMSFMFLNCPKLSSVDLSDFTADNVTYIKNMFTGCNFTGEIILSDSLVTCLKKSTHDVGLSFPLYKCLNEYTSLNDLNGGGTYRTTSTPHTPGDATTCTTPQTCTVCGMQIVAATGHTYGDWVVKTPATCTTDRKEEHTCSKCANKEEQTVADTKLGHLYGAPTWDWTADYSSATAKFTCTREGCGYIHSLPATVTSSTTAATCMAAGKTTYTATIAVTGAEFPQSTYTDTQEVPITQLNHIAATTWSKDSGNHWHECTLNCGTKLDEAAHEYTIWKVDTAATVTSAGVGHHECVCGARGADEEIPMETCSHTNKSHVPAVEATCMAAGNPEYWTCGDCGKNLDGTNTEISTIVTPVDPDNHKAWDEWQPETAATCVDKGSEKRVCADCHIGEETRETAIAPDAHDIEHHEAKTATCTEIGWDAYDTCSRCEYTTKTEIPALDHDWATTWEKDTTNHWHECSHCDEKDSNEAHTYDWVITLEPTEEAEGLKEEKCTVCGAVGDQEVIAKLVVDDNGNVSDLPTGNDYDLEIAVKESDSKYNISGVNKGYVVELYIVDGEDRTPYGEDKSVILKLVIPEGMDEFVLYRMSGDRLTEVSADEYKVEGGMLSIRTTLPDEFVFNSPAPEEPAAGIPWWVWLIVGLVAVAIVGVVIIIIVVIKKKNNDDGGAVVAAADNGEVLDKLAKQDEKIDRLIEITDGGFNDFVDE